MDDFQMTLGQYLLNIRKKKKISTRKLSEAIGFSFGYISAVENGTKNNPSMKFVKNYIKELSNNQRELEQNLYEIQELTKGRYDFGIKEVLEDNEVSLLDIFKVHDTPYSYKETDLENDFEINKNFNFPINDIHYHLSLDEDNSKFYKNVKLDGDDKKFIDDFIHNFLIQKYTILKLELEDSLVDNDNENIKKRLEVLNNRLVNIEKYQL